MKEPVQKHEVKYSAISHVLALEVVTNLLKVSGHELITLKDKSGACTISVPKQMVNFAQVGDTVLVHLGVFKGDVTKSSAILQLLP